MPYGIKKSVGGDSKENIKKMETCISSISNTNKRTGKPYTESEKIAICKTSLFSNNVKVLSEIKLSTDSDELENKEFEILSAGKKVYRGSVIEITENDLSEMETNFNANIQGTQLAVDINHDPDHKAYAWIKSIRKVGDRLMATFKDFSEEGLKLFKQKHYKYFSVEFENSFQAIVKGTKQTFKNVLRGVALTNRPVDKQLAPTYCSEILLFNTYTMKAIKKVIESLKNKDIVLAEEKEALNLLLSEIPEEDKEEIKEDIKEVNDKPETEETTNEETNEEETNEEEKTENEEEATEKEETIEASEKKFSDKLNALSERVIATEKENNRLKNELRFANIQERAKKELLLSEKNNIGLSKIDTEKATKFFSTLSDKQINEVFNIIKNVKKVDFNEYGISSDGVSNKSSELTKLAEAKIEKDPSLTLGQAMKIVLSENPEIL